MLLAGGASKRSVGEKFKLHHDACWRHWTHHVSAESKAAYIAGPAKWHELSERAAAEGLGLLDYLHLVRSELLRQFSAATEAGDRHGTAALAGRLLEALRDIGRYTGELAELAKSGGVTNNVINNNVIMTSPIFVDLQAAVIKALRPFPEARAAVVAALRELDARVMAPPPPVAAPALIEANHAA